MTSAAFLNEIEHYKAMLDEMAKKAGAMDLSTDHAGGVHFGGIRLAMYRFNQWLDKQPLPPEPEPEPKKGKK